MSFYTVSIFLITYLICGINPAIIICKKKTGEDLRKLGSGSAGSGNAVRVLGKPLGAVVIILDILKVMVSFWIISFIGNSFNQDTDVALKSVFIVASVIGHCFPIYYGFRGGKGVIVGIVTAVMIDHKIALICIIAGIVVILITRTVAMGTLSGLGLYLLMTIFLMPSYIVSVIIVSCVVMFRHRANIQRMLAKQETKLW